MKETLTYSDAGVDIEKADSLIQRIKEIAKTTPRNGVMGEIGGFGGLFSLNLTNIENPVLVSSTDGVGTKLKIAFMMQKHNTIGIDLVAMCVNDIAVQGAKPLFFLDYLSTGTLEPKTAASVIEGIAQGCKEAHCALIGGETAEMPGFYAKGEYDLAGFVVGIVDNDKIIDGSEIRVGHILVGVASDGLHANGYSLVRKICFEKLNLSIDTEIPELQSTLGDALLTPTRIYSEIIQRLARALPIHGIAHITGGGIPGNVVRMLPEACGVILKKDSWQIPPIFTFLAEKGGVKPEEMQKTFNNGIGLIMAVPEKAAADVIQRLSGMGEKAFAIGEVTERRNSQNRVLWQ